MNEPKFWDRFSPPAGIRYNGTSDQRRQAMTAWLDQAEPACAEWLIDDATRSTAATLNSISQIGQRYHVALDLLWRWQRGQCAVCGFRDPGSRRRRTRWSTLELALDHDHATGRIRGWLCWICNTNEGLCGYGILRRYRLGHPAHLLGINMTKRERGTFLSDYRPPVYA